MLSKQLIQAASGSAAAGGGLGVEDVFSTWLYTGNGSTQTITNGIDLSGEGGMVWIKRREALDPHNLYDTARGVNKLLRTTSTAAEVTSSSDLLTSFNSDGFDIGADSGGYGTNPNGASMASWTFRKAPGFFDVVTYTGNGTSQSIAHNLGCVPGCIMFKNLNTTAHWVVYHRGTSVPAEKGLVLNDTWAEDDDVYFNDTAPTSTHFTVGPKTQTNDNGQTIVAYLFAHDEQIFGEGGDQSVIKCGSYTGTGVNNNYTELGWEPQWVLIKNATTGSTYWSIFDTQRGIFTGGQDPFLKPNASDAESTNQSIDVWPTGFSVFGTSSNFNASGNTYIYIAIRRGPMKTPTDATEVFNPLARTGTGAAQTLTTGFPLDLMVDMSRPAFGSNFFQDRLRGKNALYSNATATEGTGYFNFDSATGTVGIDSGYDAALGFISYFFRRAPGFFDVVAYTGTGSTLNVAHNLSVPPELLIVKRRDGNGQWVVGHSFDLTKTLELQSANAAYSLGVNPFGTPTALYFYPHPGSGANSSGETYIAYLFATCPGISKVGSYTGTGATLSIDCGFTAGARFVLIKRTDSTGDWYVWDTTRGIVSGNDPYLLINSTAAEVTSTDYIDPLSSGFQISSTAPAAINASGGSYIFLAIA